MNKVRKPLQVVPAAMDGEFLRNVLDELDTAKEVAKHERRKFTRHPHRCLKVILIASDGGTDVAFIVATRNVSQGGASILHRQMVYPGESCRMIFPLPDGKHLLVPAKVARCRHIRGVMHEIGLRFTRPVGRDEYAQLLKQGDESLSPYMQQVG